MLGRAVIFRVSGGRELEGILRSGYCLGRYITVRSRTEGVRGRTHHLSGLVATGDDLPRSDAQRPVAAPGSRRLPGAA